MFVLMVERVLIGLIIFGGLVLVGAAGLLGEDYG